MKATKLCAAVALLALWCAGCADRTGDARGGVGNEPAAAADLIVFAAASLTDVFSELGGAFEAEQKVDVLFNFGGSSSLREQILAGAPADVYASANRSTMAELANAGEAGRPEVFATNRLEIAVPRANPGQVRGLEDFAREELLIGLCAEEVPCGALARTMLERRRITPAVDTNASDVRALLTQIESGDLDAGIVYHSDVVTTGDAVKGIEVPPDDNVANEYLIAVVGGSANRSVAEGFVAFVLGEDGQRILAAHGFEVG